SSIAAPSVNEDPDPSHPLSRLRAHIERPKDRAPQYSQAFPASYVRVHHGPPAVYVRKSIIPSKHSCVLPITPVLGRQVQLAEFAMLTDGSSSRIIASMCAFCCRLCSRPTW